MRSTSSFSRRCALVIVIISPALVGSEWKCVAVSNPTVTANPSVSAVTARIDSLQPQAPRVGDTMHATGSGSGTSPLRFAWDFGDGTVASGMQADHVYVSPGSYSVVLTVRDAASRTASDSAQIIVYARMQSSMISMALISNAVAGQPVMFMATPHDANAGTLTYLWKFSDGQFAVGPQAVATFPRAGTYLASVSVMNARGVSSSGVMAFDVVDPVP